MRGYESKFKFDMRSCESKSEIRQTQDKFEMFWYASVWVNKFDMRSCESKSEIRQTQDKFEMFWYASVWVKI